MSGGSKVSGRVTRPEPGWVLLHVPADAVGGGGRARVRLSAGGAEAVTSATPWGEGEHVIVLTPELRQAFGVAKEAEILEVTVEPETPAPSGKRPSGMRKKR